MGPTIISGAIFTIVFGVIAFLCLAAGSTLPKLGWPRIVTGIGYFHLLLAILSLVSIVVFSHDSYAVASCENVVNTSSVSGNVTTFTYMSSCAGQSQPLFFKLMTASFLWIGILEMFIIMLVIPFWLLFDYLMKVPP